MEITALLAAASAAAGTTITEPVDLGGSDRTTVLRCRTADGTTVVVKAHHDHSPYFAAEAAGLAFTSQGPRLLAVDPTARLLVMSDLGTAPSLADALLGTSPEAATFALSAWATCYGRIAAETAGRRAEFEKLRASYGPVVDEPPPVERFAEALAALGVPADDLDLKPPDAFEVFSPGDICPDNNMILPDGMRVLDFEGAGYHSVFLDVAYTRMPFATCWCVYALPAGLAERVETAYRTQVVTVYPELADDTLWRSGVRQAIDWWTVDITAALGARAARADVPMHPHRRPVPSARELLRYRWQHAAENGHGPLTGTFRRLLAATRHWEVDPLPGYPAFTPRPPAIVIS